MTLLPIQRVHQARPTTRPTTASSRSPPRASVADPCRGGPDGPPRQGATRPPRSVPDHGGRRELVGRSGREPARLLGPSACPFDVQVLDFVSGSLHWPGPSPGSVPLISRSSGPSPGNGGRSCTCRSWDPLREGLSSWHPPTIGSRATRWNVSSPNSSMTVMTRRFPCGRARGRQRRHRRTDCRSRGVGLVLPKDELDEHRPVGDVDRPGTAGPGRGSGGPSRSRAGCPGRSSPRVPSIRNIVISLIFIRSEKRSTASRSSLISLCSSCPIVRQDFVGGRSCGQFRTGR